MARNFVAASTQYGETASAVVTAYPLTMACWFKPVAANVGYAMMDMSDTAGINNRFTMNTDTTAHARFTAKDGVTSRQATSTTTFSAGVWSHACGVGVSATGRTVYLNGAGAGVENTSCTPAGLDVTTIGRISTSTPSTYMNGSLAEVAIWNVALTVGEVLALANRVSPLRIRPTALVWYVPILGVGSPEPNYGQGGSTLNATLTNAPAVSAHVGVSPAFGFDLGGY